MFVQSIVALSVLLTESITMTLGIYLPFLPFDVLIGLQSLP
ncbi:P-type ATPase, Mg2+ ATPase transport protein (fragment) [Xenorhabdus bovienii SS-2004]|uniref:P-type ATPase, Mg2+ ATPase transport protein n=1 Tax=Xenorhabdus bovienii (strain SS-2004) TaxID=406818 RepID=D3V2S6_XENBS